MKPVFKIETLTGAVLDHTITDEADNIYCKSVATDAIGHFVFSVPTRKGGSYYYDDVALFDKVKIYLGYDSVPASPTFIGRINNISAPLSVGSGYMRTISGLDQGEVLLRRFKRDKLWDAIGASTIVTELATDLSLGAGEITADATAVTLEVETKSYFDLLRAISDYWFSAGVQIKKDFFVDVDNNLVWKTRPIRTTGVESFTVGNILSYEVKRDVDPVKNDFVIYGAKERTEPADTDGWTEPASDPPPGWTALTGTMSREAVMVRKGTYSVECGDAGDTVDFYYSFGKLKDFEKLAFWARAAPISVNTQYIRILCPDTSNYYQTTASFTSGAFGFDQYDIGASQVYDADSNPSGIWTATGSPRWYNMQGVEFYLVLNDVPAWLVVDGAFCFTLGRYSGTATDATSISSCGQRDYEQTDDKLHSNSDCEKRAETLLYQLKDPPTQIELVVAGNTNVLLGDRLSITIPAEDISAANYDVISVEHSLSGQAKRFVTKVTMVNSANVRQAILDHPLKRMGDLNRQIRGLSRKEQTLS